MPRCFTSPSLSSPSGSIHLPFPLHLVCSSIAEMISLHCNCPRFHLWHQLAEISGYKFHEGRAPSYGLPMVMTGQHWCLAHETLTMYVRNLVTLFLSNRNCLEEDRSFTWANRVYVTCGETEVLWGCGSVFMIKELEYKPWPPRQVENLELGCEKAIHFQFTSEGWSGFVCVSVFNLCFKLYSQAPSA